MAYNVLNPLFPQRAVDNTGTPVASQSTAVSTAAVAATGYTATPGGTTHVQLVTFDVQGADVRVRWDGTDPTATVGHYLQAGSSYTWQASMYNAAKFIRDTSATQDATIFASPLNGG